MRTERWNRSPPCTTRWPTVWISPIDPMTRTSSLASQRTMYSTAARRSRSAAVMRRDGSSPTRTVLITLEDLGFCAKGQGGKFVADGNLIAGVGKLPFNTDGGGLCNNHPANSGGLTKVVEAVRQLRGEAHPQVQVKNCDVALAHGTGGSLGTRHGSATIIMGRE